MTVSIQKFFGAYCFLQHSLYLIHVTWQPLQYLVEKYRAGQATDDIILRLHFAWWVTKATNTYTHSKYVILFGFLRKQWLRERASLLRYSYIAFLFQTVVEISSNNCEIWCGYMCITLKRMALLCYLNTRHVIKCFKWACKPYDTCSVLYGVRY